MGSGTKNRMTRLRQPSIIPRSNARAAIAGKHGRGRGVPVLRRRDSSRVLDGEQQAKLQLPSERGLLALFTHVAQGFEIAEHAPSHRTLHEHIENGRHDLRPQ